MRLEKVVYEITGMKPGLLCHNPAMMRIGEDTMIGKKKIPTPAEEAERGLYKDYAGLYFPSIGFQRALIRACSGKKVGKTSAKMIVSGAVLLAEEKSYLVDPETNAPLTTYVIDTRRATVQRQGIMRSRPLFPSWKTEVAFEINADYVSASALDPIMTEAGMLVGVGDYRAEKTGPFGRFTARRI